MARLKLSPNRNDTPDLLLDAKGSRPHQEAARIDVYVVEDDFAEREMAQGNCLTDVQMISTARFGSGEPILCLLALVVTNTRLRADLPDQPIKDQAY